MNGGLALPAHVCAEIVADDRRFETIERADPLTVVRRIKTS
jgi:hypothetical protein